MEPVRIGLLGLGTVGAGTVNVLRRNATEIARRAGRSVEIVCASARDVNRPRDCNLEGIRLTTDPFEVTAAEDVDVVVELIGGFTLARELVFNAIENGKHVVTANKALIAMHGNEIFAAAEEKGVDVAFEAAVGGGIPIIKAIREGLAGNRIEWLAGIINGTGNYILTEMQAEGRRFADVLAEAQALGYAEADPANDIEGVDAAHKLTILASIAFGMPLRFADVETQGINAVSLEDVTYAEELGYRIKHLGIAQRQGDGVELRVQPTLVPEQALLANVNGVMNAIMVNGDAVGSTAYYGPGAGAEATASAVVADIVDVVRLITADPGHKVPHLGFQPYAINDLEVLSPSEIVCAYYIRMKVADESGVLAKISGLLAEFEINIDAIQQNEPEEPGDDVTVVMLTDEVREGKLDEALSRIESEQFVRNGINRLRLAHFDH